MLPVAGLILGIFGKKKTEAIGAPTGMAMAGIIMSIIAIAFSVISTIACVACWAAYTNNINEFYPFYDQWY